MDLTPYMWGHPAWYGGRRHHHQPMGMFDELNRDLARMDRLASAVPYWLQQGLSESHLVGNTVGDVVDDEHKFQVSVDCSNFKPEELKVTTEDQTLVIEGSHEEKTDNHGQIQRHFKRKYTLPKEVSLESAQSELSKEGVLTIIAPKKAIEGARQIPIMPGPSRQAVEGKDEGKKAKGK